MLKKTMYQQVTILAIAQALFQTVSIMVMTIGSLAGQQITHYPPLATLPIATMFLATALFTFPASLWMAKKGRRHGFLIGSFAGVMGGLIGAIGIFYSSLTLLAMGTFLVGVYQAFAQFYRFAASEVADVLFRPKAISLVMAGGIVAAIAGPLLGKLGGPLLQPNYMGSLLILAMVSLIALGALTRLHIPLTTVQQTDAHMAPTRPLAKIIRQPTYLVALLSAATGYGIMILAMTATPLAMKAHHDLGAIASVIQLHVLGMFLPSFFTGSLIVRFGVLKIIFTGVLLGFAYVLVTQTGTGFISFAAALTLVGISWNFLYIGGTSLLITTYTAAEKGKAQATNDMSIFITNLICSFSTAVLLQLLGWSNMNLTLIPWLSFTALAIIWLAIKHHKPLQLETHQ